MWKPVPWEEMPYDDQLARRVREVMTGHDGVVERRMFGGLCFMVQGNMVLGVDKDRLMVRVGPDRYEEALEQPFVGLMDITGRPMRGFVFVQPEGLLKEGDLREWVGWGVDFALSLPPK